MKALGLKFITIIITLSGDTWSIYKTFTFDALNQLFL